MNRFNRKKIRSDTDDQNVSIEKFISSIPNRVHILFEYR